MSSFYITTPIYYVNDKPHLGHAYTTLCADILARWRRLQGYDVFFLTGTDEHGAKVQQSAELAGMSPLNFASANAARYIEAWTSLDISHDFFMRTSDSRHEAVVKEILQKIYDRGFIYQGEYSGLYCIGCEKFLQNDDMVESKCPLHPNQTPVESKEENYFFKLSAFRDRLLVAIEQGDYKIIPDSRRNEVVGKLKQGLEDISITRAGVTWGIQVPWDTSQTIYVWVDALFNYYSATKFLDGKQDFWPADVHLLAKDILWFHAVIWEALLMAAELPLPKIIATHGFFTINGQKMSKSLGNVIDPLILVQEFGVEVTRYLIMAEVPFISDGDISLERFRARYQSDLANGLGNTFSRLTNMIEKYGITWPTSKTDLVVECEKYYQSFGFSDLLNALQARLKIIDQRIEQTAPWKMVKNEQTEDAKVILGECADSLLAVARALAPFMPKTAATIQSALQGGIIIKAEPLFPRHGK